MALLDGVAGSGFELIRSTVADVTEKLFAEKSDGKFASLDANLRRQ